MEQKGLDQEGVEGVQEWFRSADMEYVSMVLQEHCARRVLSRVGRLGTIQFTDLNEEQTMFQRRYVNEVQRCDAVERKLRYFEEQLNKRGIPILESAPVERFLDRIDRRQNTGGQQDFMNNLEAHVDEKENELVQLNRYNATLSNEYFAQKELMHLLGQAKLYAEEDGDSEETQTAQNAGGADVETGGGNADESLRFRFLAGTVTTSERARFERMVFRSTRGNCLMQFYLIEDDEIRDVETDEIVQKEAFIIFFQAAYIENKIRKICEAFGVRIFEIPDLSNVPAIVQRLEEVNVDINDRRAVLEKSEADIEILLREVAESIVVWKWVVMREKSIYHAMNHFAMDVQGMLRAEGWVVKTKKEELFQEVIEAHEESQGDAPGQSVPSSCNTVPQEKWPSSPPSFFKVNKFTEVFQNFVNTYGVPRYHEANPAVMTVITFPFEFGVMFGDIGHGLLLTIFAAYVIWNENWFKKMASGEMIAMLYGGRYLLLLMGFFAMYSGSLYNDWFGMGLRIFLPMWVLDEDASNAEELAFVPRPDYVYPYGADPTWHRAENDLLYFNSVKMKMAVVFGVTHMIVGLIHRIQNSLYFQDKRGFFHNLDFWFEALPMIIFMLALFGYMCFMIIYKWTLDWLTTPEEGCTRTNCNNPPSLISQLINIALAPGDVPADEQLYDGQGTVQLVLLFVAVLMIPLMLIPKPYFMLKRMKAEKKREGTEHGNGNLHAEDGHGETDELMIGDADHGANGHFHGASGTGGHHEEEHSAGDIIIHQAIETIEFSLGCISNTASYLRLWALSLAHSQLSQVFLEKALLDFITESGGMGVIVTFGGYAVFAAITFAVLMLMDNLECFLHALRLHWVEFQNKFFAGDGVAFTPLNFRVALANPVSS